MSGLEDSGRRRRVGGGRKVGDKQKDPRALMKDAGYNSNWLSPIEFCLALMNNDMALLKLDRDPTVSQRIEAARIASPYMHQKLPSLVEQNVTHSWADIVQEAEGRLNTMRQPHVEPGQDSRVH